MSIKKYTPLRVIESIENSSKNAFTDNGYSDVIECSRFMDCLAEIECRKAVKITAMPNESERSKAIRVCNLMKRKEDEINSTAVLVYCADSWRRNKIVLCVHEELVDALAKTEYGIIEEPDKLNISKSTMYVDLETDGDPLDILGTKISGFFAAIGKEDKDKDSYKLINICFVNADGTFRPITFDLYKLKGKTVHEFVGEIGVSLSCVSAEERAYVVRGLVYALSILLYTCVTNVDIKENEQQKKIYKKASQIRNRYSEVRKFNLGFNYDSEKDKGNIRAWVQELDGDVPSFKWGIKE